MSASLSPSARGVADAAPAERVHGWVRTRRSLLLLGPAFVAAVAYVDPGNVGTNVAAGARYGYLHAA